MTTCRNAAWFAKRCSKTAKFTVRVNDDPDTDIELCTVHANLAVTRCHPVPVTLTPLDGKETTTP